MSNAQPTSIRARKRGNTIRKAVLALLVLVFLLSLTLLLGVSTGLIGIYFPQLTGSYAVGRISYDLLDPSRKEPFLNNPHAKREMMVTLYYPADPPSNAHPAPYIEGTMADLLASKVHLPAVAVQLIHAHAFEQVPIARGTFPVVLFSPGIGTPPVEYTISVEDVASHGYVVAMLYHTYSIPFTVFADGRVALLNEAGIRPENEPAGTSEAQTNQDRDAIGAVWVADACFTLDQLTKLNSDDKLLQGHLNLEEVGMYGYAFGGATAAEVCREDSRFKACLNMDGTAFRMTNSSQIKQPLLWMASDYSQVTDSQLQQLQLTRREFNAKMQQRNQERERFVQRLSQGYVFILKGSTQAIPQPEVLQTTFSSLFYSFGLGDLLCECNDLEAAERHLLQGLALVNETLTVEASGAMLGHTTLARLQQARGNFREALATLDALARLAQQRHFASNVVAQGKAVRAQLELAQGNLAAAIRWADTSGLSTEDDDLRYPRESEYLALVRVRIAQSREAPAGFFLRDALHLLDRLRESAEVKARLGSVLEILIVRALALEAQGNRTGALATLERALLLAAPEGYIRLFVDEGAPMLALLRRAQAHSAVPQYVATLLTAFGGAIPCGSCFSS